MMEPVTQHFRFAETIDASTRTKSGESFNCETVCKELKDQSASQEDCVRKI